MLHHVQVLTQRLPLAQQGTVLRYYHQAQHASHYVTQATLYQVLQAATWAHSQQQHARRTLAMLRQTPQMEIKETAPHTLHPV
jgi:hypothetical protein